MKRKGFGLAWRTSVFTALFFLILTSVNFYTGDLTPNVQIWQGYFTLMVKENSDMNVPALLSENGFEFVSLENEKIDFFDYCGMRSVLFTELDQNLDVLDPRFDSYMRKIPAFFSAYYEDTDWKIIYIKSTEGLNSFAGRIAAVFPENSSSDWILADRKSQPNGYLPLIFAAFFVLCIFFGKTRRWGILFYAFPWAGVLRSGNLPLFIACGMIILSVFLVRARVFEVWKKHLDYPFSPGYFREKLRFSNILFIGVFTVCVIWMHSFRLGWQIIPFVSSGILGLFSLLFLELSLVYLKVKRRDHRLFVPVFIIKKENRNIYNRGSLLPLVPALFLASFLFFPVGEEQITAPVPTPVFFASQDINPGYNWEGLQFLANMRQENYYPDIVDYVSHRAFQEVFFYGGHYGFPKNGDRIEQEVVQVNDSGLHKDLVVLKEFTDHWYEDILSGNEKEGMAALLLNQKSLCKIETAGTVSVGGESSSNKAGFAIFSFYFFVILLFAGIGSRKRRGIRIRETEQITYIRELKKEHTA